MSKHIELVEKFLADPSSVSQEELKENSMSAGAAVDHDEIYSKKWCLAFYANATSDYAFWVSYFLGPSLGLNSAANADHFIELTAHRLKRYYEVLALKEQS